MKWGRFFLSPRSFRTVPGEFTCVIVLHIDIVVTEAVVILGEVVRTFD